MSPLRKRMIDDLKLAGYSERTQEAYVRAVWQLAVHWHKSPASITEDELRDYFVYLREDKHFARSSMTIALCGIKFLFERRCSALCEFAPWSSSPISCGHAAAAIGPASVRPCCRRICVPFGRRTAALGGHVHRCDRCQHEHFSYHSCLSRSCPTCQGQRTREWVVKQQERLLDCDYFLCTFTLPHTLRSVARAHQKPVYGALLQAAAAALETLCLDPKYLGAQPGILAVLHTHSRDLGFHPHAHLLCCAGGLTPQGHWRFPTNAHFLVPGWALSKIFRAKLRDALEHAGRGQRCPAKCGKLDCSVTSRVLRQKTQRVRGV